MRRFFLTLLLITASFIARTQGDNSTFKNHLSKLDESMAQGQSLLPLASTFVQLGSTAKDNWLPYYYAAYCYVMEAFTCDLSMTDSLLDQSAFYINKADSLSNSSNKIDQSEICCIRSLIASARITVDPAKRGMEYGMESSDMMNAAKILNPENPRVYFLEAQSLMYTPEAYGGGCKNARPNLEKSLKKYESFKPASILHPNWGKEEVATLLEQCAK